jgi:hypothetical protein
MACRSIEDGDADKIFATVAHQNSLIGHFSLSRLLWALKADIQHIRVRIIVDPKALGRKREQERESLTA